MSGQCEHQRNGEGPSPEASVLDGGTVKFMGGDCFLRRYEIEGDCFLRRSEIEERSGQSSKWTPKGTGQPCPPWPSALAEVKAVPEKALSPSPKPPGAEASEVLGTGHGLSVCSCAKTILKQILSNK